MCLLLGIGCCLTEIAPFVFAPASSNNKQIGDHGWENSSALHPFSRTLRESFVMFICSGATANNCRSHANSQSARLETASAKLLLGKNSVFYLFLQK